VGVFCRLRDDGGERDPPEHRGGEQIQGGRQTRAPHRTQGHDILSTHLHNAQFRNNLIASPVFTFLFTCDNVDHKQEVRFLLYLLCTRSNCHLTIITPVNWTKIKQVLL